MPGSVINTVDRQPPGLQRIASRRTEHARQQDASSRWRCICVLGAAGRLAAPCPNGPQRSAAELMDVVMWNRSRSGGRSR